MNLTTTYAGRMLAALAISVGLIQCGASDAPDGETPTPEETGAYTRVSVRDMEWVPFSHSFAVQGNVETDRVANVLAEFPGVVEEVLRKEGDQVAKGDALVRINTDVLGKQREELLTQLALAQTLLERQERLWGKDIGSEVDLLQAQAGVQSLERSLATLDEQLDQAVIRAPFSGVLDRIFSNVGEMAAPPMPVVRVVDLNDLYVRASVSDHYAGALSEGQEVRVEVRGMEEGLESQIRRVGQYITAANRSIDLTVDLPKGTRMLPNMVATVHITDLALDSALTLPASLVQQDASGQDFVYVVQDDVAQKRSVVSGMLSEGMLLIESGLNPGDQVIERGATRVISGERVELMES